MAIPVPEKVCGYCGRPCDYGKFCSSACQSDYADDNADIPEDEPGDIDSDAGYDPYAGGPEPFDYPDYEPEEYDPPW